MHMYIIVAISMVSTTALLVYLNRQANPKNLNPLSRYPVLGLYSFFGYLMIFIALAILIGPRLSSHPPTYYHPLVWALIAAIFLFGLYLLRMTRMHHITTEGDYFTVHPTFGSSTTFQFGNIQSVSFNPMNSIITIRDRDGQKARIYLHIVGLKLLLERIAASSEIELGGAGRILKVGSNKLR